MLLPHLLPFLDAEMDRLQRARDLLAYTPVELSFSDPTELDALGPLIGGAPEPGTTRPLPVPASPPIAPPVIVLKPYRPAADRKPRRRHVTPSETALRSSVPAGPVAISASDVRKAQETKTARAAKPVPELPLTLDWTRPSADARSADALLQRLLNIGKGDLSAEHEEAARPARV